jgi:hypothetical protein
MSHMFQAQEAITLALLRIMVVSAQICGAAHFQLGSMVRNTQYEA